MTTAPSCWSWPPSLRDSNRAVRFTHLAQRVGDGRAVLRLRYIANGDFMNWQYYDNQSKGDDKGEPGREGGGGGEGDEGGGGGERARAYLSEPRLRPAICPSTRCVAPICEKMTAFQELGICCVS